MLITISQIIVAGVYLIAMFLFVIKKVYVSHQGERERIITLIWDKKYIIAFITALFTVIMLFLNMAKPNEKPPVQLGLDLARELADERLIAENAMQAKTIEELKEQLASKDIPDYQQTAKKYWNEGKLPEAINSVDTDAALKDAAERLIFKAQLYIANFQFPEAEAHYKQAADIS
ncbi:hypothetical protein FACS1894181_01220 [Bacteroidia bacterium]|nr:hypothetical protein FACS1894181_01220 [Bacteroidia bacterium]